MSVRSPRRRPLAPSPWRSAYPTSRSRRSRGRRALAVGLLTAIAVCGAGARPASAFDLQGHRGARGLAPENTLAGFRKALEIGVSTLELDLAMTRDGVLVVSHDPVLNPDVVRGPDGRWLAAPGPVLNTLTLAEVKRNRSWRAGRDRREDLSQRYATWHGRIAA